MLTGHRRFPMMTGQIPIHLMQLWARIQFIFQTENAGFQVGGELKPWGDATRRIDGNQGAQIVFLLAIQEDHRKSGRTWHRLGYVCGIR